jgi:thiamine-monophosphate kinase
MDVSDGLAGDLAKMLRVSGVTASVEADRIPLSPAAHAALGAEPDLMERILTGGDDYEILCTVASDRLADLQAEAHKAGVPLVPIGQVVEGEELPVFRWRGMERRFEAGSFSHF